MLTQFAAHCSQGHWAVVCSLMFIPFLEYVYCVSSIKSHVYCVSSIKSHVYCVSSIKSHAYCVSGIKSHLVISENQFQEKSSNSCKKGENFKLNLSQNKRCALFFTDKYNS